MRTMKTIVIRVWVPTMLAGAVALSAQAPKKVGYDDTPQLPGQPWKVHDKERPNPAIVTLGTASTPEAPGKAPGDAIVLFDGTDLSKWRTGDGKPSGWKLEKGAMVCPPKGTEGGGDIWTKEEFGDIQLHIEWSAPTPPEGESQGRGNSGVFFFGMYELQVLDSYDNVTYADGQAAALYGQWPPLVNVCRPPGEWQTYDLAFTAPRFKDGKLESPAFITVFHNGVLVHNHRKLIGATGHRTVA